MSSKFEVDLNGKAIEQVELTPLEQAVEKVQKYYEGVDLDSARFQALADYIHEIAAERICEFDREDQSRINRLNGIREAIRQRENSNEFYKAEFKQAKLFANELANVLSAAGASKYSQNHSVHGFLYHNILWKRINQEIESKNQESSTLHNK
jgi:Rad3-related DNA helicase